MYPYEMTTNLRERGKEDSIRLNFGSLYAVIKSLEKHALIQATHTERVGNRPERIVYAITAEGKVEAVDWLRELIGEPVKEYPAFEAGLSLLPMLTPEDAITLLSGRLVQLDADLSERQLERQSPQVRHLPELFLIESDYRVAMLGAERAFVAALADRIRSGHLGGIDLWVRLHELLAAGHSHDQLNAELATYLAGATGGEAAGHPT
jgi:DNA-binding PadR family transcriptional regulator